MNLVEEPVLPDPIASGPYESQQARVDRWILVAVILTPLVLLALSTGFALMLASGIRDFTHMILQAVISLVSTTITTTLIVWICLREPLLGGHWKARMFFQLILVLCCVAYKVGQQLTVMWAVGANPTSSMLWIYIGIQNLIWYAGLVIFMLSGRALSGIVLVSADHDKVSPRRRLSIAHLLLLTAGLAVLFGVVRQLADLLRAYESSMLALPMILLPFLTLLLYVTAVLILIKTRVQPWWQRLPIAILAYGCAGVTSSYVCYSFADPTLYAYMTSSMFFMQQIMASITTILGINIGLWILTRLGFRFEQRKATTMGVA